MPHCLQLAKHLVKYNGQRGASPNHMGRIILPFILICLAVGHRDQSDPWIEFLKNKQ